MSNPRNKIYLGDSVYASMDQGMICLTTENGRGPASNKIYLELEILDNLNTWVEVLRQQGKSSEGAGDGHRGSTDQG